MKKESALFLLLAGAVLTAGNPKPVINPHGNLIDENGKIRYYLAQASGHVAQGKLKLFGKLWRGKYPDCYRWLYEGTMNEAYFQRLGINMMHFNSENNRIAAAFPEYTPEKLQDYFGFYHEMLKKYDAEKMNRQWGRGAYQDHIDNMRTFTHTPLYLNLTATTSHVLRIYPEITGKFLKPGSIADNPRGSASSLCCDLSSPNGRELMKKLCAAELDWFKMVGVEPFMVKIYNEPSYENYSEYARKDFVRYLKKKFGTVEAMNRIWGTKYRSFEGIGVRPTEKNFSVGAGIEFRKMSELRYAEMTNEMDKIIKQKFHCPTFVQLMGGNHAVTLEHGNNVYLLHREREIIVSGTGNYSFSSFEEYDDATPAREALSVSLDFKNNLLRHGIYFPLAENKPYLDTENYVSRSSSAYFRAVMWREIALGKQTMLFWEIAGMDKPGAKKPGFCLLYPDVMQPTELEVWKTMPKELEKTGTFFLDRRNKCYAPQAGFLYSNATLRRAALTREPEGLAATMDLLAALHFSYYDCAGCFEENLQEKLGKFKVFFLGDVTNTTEAANLLLQNYVKNGGILFVSGALPKNEYDKKLTGPLWDVSFAPTAKTIGVMQEFQVKAVTGRKIVGSKEWKVTGMVNGLPVLAEKRFGKGKVIVLAATLQDYALAELLKPVMSNANIRPYGRILKLDKEESFPNLEMFCFREPAKNGRTGWMLFNHNQETKLFRLAVPGGAKTVWDPVKGVVYPVTDGFAAILLSPLDCAVLMVNDPKESGKSMTLPELALKLQKKRKAERSGKLTRRSTVVNFSNCANTGFDNAQHWPTDSVFIEPGHQYLRGVPFHKQVFGDVIFDVIRFDFNSNRTCLALKSEAHPKFPAQVTLPIDRQCGDLMLLASTVGGKTGERAFSVRFNYADGSSVTQNVTKGIDVGDWKISRNSAELQRQAVWRDPEGYGLFLTEVHNPKPSKFVSTVTFLSAESAVSPVICGISALDTVFQKEYRHSVPLSKVFPQMQQPKVKNSRNSWKDNEFLCDQPYAELRTADNRPSPYLDTPEKIDRCVLRGAVKIDRDAFGKFHPLSWFTVTLPGSKCRYMTYYNHLENYFINKSAEHWVEFELPLKEFRGGLQSIFRIAIGPGRPFGKQKRIRDLRLEW